MGPPRNGYWLLVGTFPDVLALIEIETPWIHGWSKPQETQKVMSGWWFGTWPLFSISYMGCHPSH